MASEEGADTLETWLNKVTDPENTSERWDCIQGFYQQVNAQPDGPQVATRLLAHKIQSPQERESLQALTLLEVCMNNCGKHFHSEATKFRFLNELIKVLSPKYLGTWTTALVKLRVTEVLYGWTLWLKDEPKVQEAYRMLKKQGIVKKDPKLPDTVVMQPLCPRQEVSVFDDEGKSQLLSQLLKSTRPEDLQTANRLIKSTLKEEQEKIEKEGRRVGTLQDVENCTSQLKSLLSQQYTQHTQDMQDVYDRCDRLRPILFRLASETVDDDKVLAEILRGNDKITDVMNLYRVKTQKQEPETQTVPSQSHNSQDPASPVKTYHLIDLSVLGDSATAGCIEDSSSLLLLEEDVCPHVADSCIPRTLGVKSYLEELTQLEDKMKVMKESGSIETTNGKGAYNNHSASVLPVKKVNPFRSELDDMNQMNQPGISEYKPHPPSSLMNITVSLDSIKPSHLKPITVFDHHGIRVSFHFTKEAPPSRPDIAVIIISTVNTSALPVSDFLFLTAVPKTMQVKLQPPTRSDLPAYNPILPPAAISQVLLLSNPLKRPVRVRVRLSMMLGEHSVQLEAEIDHFPEWDSWNNP
ncbi:ADP-ribosylation factor-binding protein GGA3-like isoform X1 [Electrophorus electricus]|uniref:ADP-ribosylation factor-binding protein GGA3-like isoform X1 n=1 Tax=Electrophorus electricus TaxID=8005 RepID=UPI0015CFE6F2|nr:ADP-ribosylation factor-binding protein GGA3-like isoform X1 [Electrophorus electricus]